MTLSTNVYVLDEIDPYGVFLHCQQLLAKYDDEHRSVADQRWREDDGWRGDGSRVFRNEIGQGLPAILQVAFRPDMMLVSPEQTGHDEDCDEECSGLLHRPACRLDIDFDTAYGYRDSRKWGCGELHAVLVAELGAWLSEAGVRWSWRNEFTGEVHSGPERLVDLVSGGGKATSWFRSTVLPAIATLR